MSAKHWLALVGLACTTFIFNTSEFIPIGLLSDIAADFATTEARAGLIISVYAWAVMLLSLPLMMAASKMELRRLMIFTVATFVIFQFASALSSGYYMLMASRIGVACAHSIFWSIVSPLAVRIVPERRSALALSVVVTGSSLAMILGMPLGRVIGLYMGWRMTFFSIGAFALAVLIFLARQLPVMPSQGAFKVRQLPGLLHNRLLVGIYIFTLILVTAHFAGYSYIEPFLKQVSAMPDDLITTTLMVFGGAGIIGSFLFSKFYNTNRIRFINTVIILVAICLALLMPSSQSWIGVILVCAVWGMAITAFNVSFQAEIIAVCSGESVAVAMAIFSGIYNLGIGSGTYLGGLVCTHASVSHIGHAGAIVAVAAFLFWLIAVLTPFRRARGQL